MNITERSREFDKVEEYLLTLSKDAMSLKDVEDATVIPVAGYLVYEDINSKDEEVEILSIITPTNEVYSCQSATFKKSFKQMWDLMGGQSFSIIKTSGTTKAGRPYIDCTLDRKSVNK